jgi:hypothetical protein
LNLRPLGYEPSELPNCSTPRRVCPYFMNSWGPKQIGAVAAGQGPPAAAWAARVRPGRWSIEPHTAGSMEH